ncbi:MAG: hypothetical protein IJ309_02030 [Clostridia bacterium]|nr:hypothetical protein [Clostridia bacterium]
MARIKLNLVNRENFYSIMLSDLEKELYYICVDSLAEGDFTITCNCADIPSDDSLNRIFYAIIYGCPELFYVVQEYETRISDNRVTFIFKNKYPDQDLQEMANRLDREIQRAATRVLKFESQEDKLKRLNKYLCTRVSPEFSAEGSYGDAYGALILKRARCEGFAKAACLILHKVGIPCVIAYGKAIVPGGGQEDHAWNIVILDDNNYQFDFTWNANSTMHGIPSLQYAFLDDAQMIIEHKPEFDPYPICSDASKTVWAENGAPVKYISDLHRTKIVPYGDNYMAIAKLTRKLTRDELQNEVLNWMRTELSAPTFGCSMSYIYNDRLDLLVMYFTN